MTNKYISLIEAIEAGAHAASTLKSGDEFTGAMDAAAQLYNAGTKEYDCFVSGYIAAINEIFPNGIKCDIIDNTWIIQ